MNQGRYQAHCRVCFLVFEADSLEDVVRKTTEHENKAACVRPVYDARQGGWVKDPVPAVSEVV